MQTALDCIPCLIRQILAAARLATADTAVHQRVVRDAMMLLSQADLTASPPALAQQTHELLYQLTGDTDPYRAEKKRFNQLAQSLLADMEQQLATADNPLALAARFAIAGNVIDLGAKTGLDEAHVHEAMAQVLNEPFFGQIQAFADAADRAESILYLADNAGEIVLDQLLIQQLGPQRITVAVRGKPIINDATLQDAQAVGLTELVQVIDNGTAIPGTVLEACSPQFRDRFHAADMIISKGQGNFETLNSVQANLWFLFKVKCDMVSRQVGLPVGTHVLMHAEDARTQMNHTNTH